MDDFCRTIALINNSLLHDLIYIQSVENHINYTQSLFKEKGILLTEEIKEEIALWVSYHHANRLVKYLFRRRTGGEPKNPLLRLEEKTNKKEIKMRFE